jgi:hypothetical protein
MLYLDRFVKWIKCPSCIRVTLTGLKGLLIAIGPTTLLILQTLGYPTTDVEKGIATATTILGVVLTMLDQLPSALVKSTKDIEGVQVHVDTSLDPKTGKPIAPQAVVNIANSPTPDVFPMIGGPRQPSDHDDAPTVDPSKVTET